MAKASASEVSESPVPPRAEMTSERRFLGTSLFLRASRCERKPGQATATFVSLMVILFRCFRILFGGLFVTTVVALGLYQAVSSPPLHLYYPIAEPAGPSSIYIPGSGFSGFWFQLGFLQALPNIHNHDFYCYSSGCLSVLMAMMNTTLETATDRTLAIQALWKEGHISRYELVDRFIDNLFLSAEDATAFAKRVHILVTTATHGVTIKNASNATELKELLIKTTWIPYVTGRGLWYGDEQSDEMHLDGGFSRMLHPKCHVELHVPVTWELTPHTFNPNLDRAQVENFWLSGQQYSDKFF